jgi:pimeloyl-ACP methyl ester carboxylesterase
MPSLKRNGKPSIYYETWGSRSLPKLFIISPSNTALPLLQPYLAGPGGFSKLDRKFHCLAFDHRGTGQSGMPDGTWPVPPTLGEYAADALALLDHMGWTSAHVLAFSFGAAVAQELLLQLGQEEAGGAPNYGSIAAAAPTTTTFAFRPQHVLLVCPAVDVDGTPSGSYPLHSLLDLSEYDRAERTLLLADTRRGYDWMTSEEGQAAMHYVQNADSRQQAEPGAFEGRTYQMHARRAHATLTRLATATGGDGGSAAADSVKDGEAASASSSPAPASMTRSDDGAGRATVQPAGPGGSAAAAPKASPAADTPLLGDDGAAMTLASKAPLCDGEMAIFGAIHDAITPPHAAMRLHAALARSSLVWFDTGHWPNLAREAKDAFDRAAVGFLSGVGVPNDVLESSKQLAKRIPDKPAAHSFDGGGGDCNCLNGCVLM